MNNLNNTICFYIAAFELAESLPTYFLYMYMQVQPSGESLRIMWATCGLKLASPENNTCGVSRTTVIHTKTDPARCPMLSCVFSLISLSLNTFCCQLQKAIREPQRMSHRVSLTKTDQGERVCKRS